VEVTTIAKSFCICFYILVCIAFDMKAIVYSYDQQKVENANCWYHGVIHVRIKSIWETRGSL